MADNLGTKGIITGTIGSGVMGLAIGIFAPEIAFLVFGTMFLQSFSASLRLQGQIDSEVKRQQGVCDQIKFSKDQLSQLNGILTLLQGQGSINEQQLVTQVGNMSSQTTAEINKLKSLQSDFKTNLMIQVIIYTVIVAILGIIIVLKKK